MYLVGIARYDEAVPRLDAVITEAVSIATPEVAAKLVRTTDEANRRLVEMERASFVHVAAGERTEAWMLLDSHEYDAFKAVYVQGIEAFGNELEGFAAARAANLHKREWLETSGLILGGGMFLVAAAVAARGYARLRIALRHTEAAMRHDVLTGLPNRLKLREHMGGDPRTAAPVRRRRRSVLSGPGRLQGRQ